MTLTRWQPTSRLSCLVLLILTLCLSHFETLKQVQCLPNQPQPTTPTTTTPAPVPTEPSAESATQPTPPPQPEIPPNAVVQVDMRLRDNVHRHHTHTYRQMAVNNPYSGPNLVLRRGEMVNMYITLRRPYDINRDRLRLEASFGSAPALDKGTLIYIPLIRNLQNNASSPLNNMSEQPLKWQAQIISTSVSKSNAGNTNRDNPNQIEARFWLPANCAIGIWRLKVSTKLTNSKEPLNSFNIRESFYVLFNAWCKDDTVYLQREDARQEYVMNEVGKVYMGQYNRPTGTRWSYAQFSEYVLPGMMMLLDRTRLDVTQRGDVVKISRAISATMNSHDDMGLLVGNWSGNYLDGVSPWAWSNSGSIFERYVRSGGRPVKFGQCWVFGGLTTTALRTLGIPARTITNFVSAHDTDLSLTVDQFNSDRGEKISGINGDSIWNFHVWSDAWMLREDLPPEYSGWQAIDATPQETSMGMYQLGPASVEAVRRGKVTFAYDVGFVYSEVNADVVTWRHDPRSPFQWRRMVAQTDHVGKMIYTKRIGNLDESRYGTHDAEDITHQYKYREGSRDERNSYNDASKLAGLDLILQNH